MGKIYKYIFLSLIGICLIATVFWGLANTSPVMLQKNMAIASLLNSTENPSPVFPTLIPDQAYVIQDNANYKLYYAGSDFGSINLATSSDGINWTPYAGNPVLNETSAVQGQHADVHFYSSGFTGANSGTNPSSGTMYYRMWYQGAVPGIGGWRYAESPDGINWYNHIAVTQTGTPVFSAATGVDYGIADAVYTPGGEGGDPNKTFRIYANVQWELAPHSSDELVVMAYSPNGYVWTGYDPTSVGYATPVFAGTSDGVSFDTDHIGWFKVIKNSDTDWEAFYSGGKGTTYQALNGIGYATSNDGINWTRRETLFTTNDAVAWRNNSVWMPSVVKSGNNYKIFFLGSNNPMTDGSWIWWKVGEADLAKDTTPPTVASTSPAGSATSISPGQGIIATFSEPMDPATITTFSFTLKKGATPIAGVVSYSNLKATFVSSVILDSNSVYTATITTGVKDVAGNALASNYTWNFTTGGNYQSWSDQGVDYTAPSGSAYYPSVIYDANGFGTATPEYKMWYSDGNGSVFLATATDGVAWGTPTTMAGLANAHHTQVVYDANCFGITPCNAGTAKYRMWFWDIGAPTIYSISSMATAESADGINWTGQTAVTQNPSAKLIQDPDSGTGWNRGTYGPVNVFYQSGAINTGTEPFNYSYVMYYDGTDGSHEYTGLAYSTDGLNWNAYSVNPVLQGSSSGAWDCYSSVYGTIYKDSAGFHYFYSGKGQDDGSGNCADTASNNFDGISYASSTDGKTWVKDAKPIFHISDGVSYRSGRIYTPSVINDGSGILRMYFSVTDASGTPKKIGYATLAQPVTVIPTTPVITLLGVPHVILYQGQIYTDAGATAHDGTDGDITSSINVTNAVDTSTIGTYSVTYNVENSIHVSATPVVRTVQVLPSSTTMSTVNTSQDTDIFIPQNINTSTLDLTHFQSGNSASLTNDIMITKTTAVGDVVVNIPAGVTLTSGAGSWNGIINLPEVNNNPTVVASSGNTAQVFSAIEIGLGDTPVTFNKGVRISFTGANGKLVGFSRNGVFTQVTSVCPDDTQTAGDALTFSSDCKINSGNDLVVWTKHFTTYVVYSESPIAVAGGGGGNSYQPYLSSNASQNTAVNQTQPSQIATNGNRAGQPYQFTRYLKLGDIGYDVKQLQIFLNNHGFILADTGWGSPGDETRYFGPITFQALFKFQEANYDAILKPSGFQKGTGMFYYYTMKFVNNLLLNGK